MSSLLLGVSVGEQARVGGTHKRAAANVHGSACDGADSLFTGSHPKIALRRLMVDIPHKQSFFVYL